MTFEQLLYTYELAKHKSLQQTSFLLHISKSALSQSISQFENELGLTLFKRSHAGSEPTTELVKLLPNIQKVLALQMEIKKDAQNMSDERTKHFSFEYQNTMPDALLKKVIAAVKNYSHSLSFTITANNDDQILIDLQNNKIDAGLIVVDRAKLQMINNNSALVFKQMGTSKLRLCMSPSNKLANEKKLSISQVQQLKFISFNDEYNQKAFARLENLCGPLPMLLESDDENTIYDAALELDAVFLAREWQTNVSINKKGRRFSSVDISNLINDQFFVGWVFNNGTFDSQLLKQLTVF